MILEGGVFEEIDGAVDDDLVEGGFDLLNGSAGGLVEGVREADVVEFLGGDPAEGVGGVLLDNGFELLAAFWSELFAVGEAGDFVMQNAGADKKRPSPRAAPDFVNSENCHFFGLFFGFARTFGVALFFYSFGVGFFGGEDFFELFCGGRWCCVGGRCGVCRIGLWCSVGFGGLGSCDGFCCGEIIDGVAIKIFADEAGGFAGAIAEVA